MVPDGATDLVMDIPAGGLQKIVEREMDYIIIIGEQLIQLKLAEVKEMGIQIIFHGRS